MSPKPATSRSKFTKTSFKVRDKIISRLIGLHGSKFKGQGIDLKNIREYQIGDNFRDIDWKASAKTNKIYVKEYCEDKLIRIILAIDSSPSMFYNFSENPQKYEQIIDIAITMNAIAEANNDLVSLIFFPSNKMGLTVPFSKSRAQLQKVIGTIRNEYTKTSIKEGKNIAEPNMDNFISTMCDRKLKKSLCLFITDYLDTQDPYMEKMLNRIALRHQLIIIVLKENFMTLGEASGDGRFVDIETKKFIEINLNDNSTKQKLTTTYQDYYLSLDKYLTAKGIIPIFLEKDSVFILEFIKALTKIKRSIYI